MEKGFLIIAFTDKARDALIKGQHNDDARDSLALRALTLYEERFHRIVKSKVESFPTVQYEATTPCLFIISNAGDGPLIRLSNAFFLHGYTLGSGHDPKHLATAKNNIGHYVTHLDIQFPDFTPIP